jgi:hypothetical protein
MSFSAHAANPPLLVLYDVRPPFVTFDGQRLQGSIGARAQIALERSGLHFELREIPVPRQLLMIEQNLSAACAVARVKTVERVRIGTFSAVVAESPPYVAITREESSLPVPPSLKLWAAHEELRWGIASGLYYSDFVQQEIQLARAQISRFSAAHLHLANLLAARRIDFFIAQKDEAQEVLDRNNALAGLRLRVQRLSDLSEGEKRFFYCSKSVSGASLRAINDALK